MVVMTIRNSDKSNFFLCFLSIWISFSFATQEKVLNATDYISPTDADVAVGLYNLFRDAKEGGFTKIQFEKGIYHVYDDRAYEQLMFISNHDSGLRKIAFPIIDFPRLEIDGGGSEFIIHGLVIGIAIENSQNVTIKNLTFDHYRPTHSELQVIATDDKSNSIDFSIAPEYPYEIRNGKLIFLKRGFENNLDREIYFDPKTNAVAFQSRKMMPLEKLNNSLVQNLDLKDTLYSIDKNSPIYKERGKFSQLKAEELRPGVVRLTGVNENMPQVGWILAVKGTNGNNRLAPGIRILNSEDIKIDHVTVHHASGMGLIAQGCNNITLDYFKVEPRAGSSRVLSTTADATHFLGCRGLIKMDNCSFQNQMDDATNIHGTYMEIVDIDRENNEIGAKLGHFQQIGYDIGIANDSMVIVNPKVSAKPIAHFSLKEVEKINNQYYKVKFKQPIPSGVDVGYYLENTQAYPNVQITNCKVLNNRARGFLISSPKKVTIENNVFSCMMSAILCPNEFTFWYESGYVNDLTIKNNEFLDSSYGFATPNPVIGIYAVSTDGSYIHNRITIENNTFKNYSSDILFAEHVKELVVKGNTMEYSGTYPLDGKPTVITLREIGQSTIINNKIDKRFTSFLDIEPKDGKLTEKSNTKF